jgi:anti-sigma regulatory factor (Ser/Thr protein kinase)
MTAQPARWASCGAPNRIDGFESVSPPLSLVRAARPAQDSGGATGFAARTLDHDPQSPGTARHFTRSALRDWGMDELVDDIAVSVSEMVTNALRHGASPWNPVPAQPVLLSLLRRGITVLCAVIDPGTTVPEVRGQDDLAETGRGLHIVECLSDAWGWTTPGPSGKAVWARFSARGSIPGQRTRTDAVGIAHHADARLTDSRHTGSQDAGWDPLTRLLLVEILGGNGPFWPENAEPRAGEGRHGDGAGKD